MGLYVIDGLLTGGVNAILPAVLTIVALREDVRLLLSQSLDADGVEPPIE